MTFGRWVGPEGGGGCFRGGGGGGGLSLFFDLAS